MISVILVSVILISDIHISGIPLSVIQLSGIPLSSILLSGIPLSSFLMIFILMSVILMSVILMIVIIQNVTHLNVAAPSEVDLGLDCYSSPKLEQVQKFFIFCLRRRGCRRRHVGSSKNIWPTDVWPTQSFGLHNCDSIF